MLVGNKTDLPPQRHQVREELASEWAANNGLDFFQVSAVSSTAVVVLHCTRAAAAPQQGRGGGKTGNQLCRGACTRSFGARGVAPMAKTKTRLGVWPAPDGGC